MSSETIAAEKSALRAQLIAIRAKLDQQEKEAADGDILSNLIRTQEYRACPLLLTFVSKEDEVDTLEIIRHALSAGKTVAVPRCVRGKPEMGFYIITNLEELVCGSYGILEPTGDPDRQVDKNIDGLCLLPGLAFDRCGGRLGYGGGYYDRFLADFGGVTAGLCRSVTLSEDRLPTDGHDRPVSLVITDREVIRPVLNAK